jgi:hypothetical protein
MTAAAAACSPRARVQSELTTVVGSTLTTVVDSTT